MNCSYEDSEASTGLMNKEELISSEINKADESLLSNPISSLAKTTLIRVDKELSFANKTSSINEDDAKDTSLIPLSFLLTIFDNIVGPKIVHHWTTVSEKVENGSSPEKKKRKLFQLDENLLKYIAIHTLNGELYQEKLINHHKYRLYLIKEIECAIFSIFFDANTVSTSSYGSSAYEDYTSTSENESHLSNDEAQCSSINKNNTKTTLNCFSLILPLENKSILFDKFGDNTKFFINSFENIIMEFKVFAQIKPKSNKVTTALSNLTEALTTFCKTLNTLKFRGIHPNNNDIQPMTPFRIRIVDTFLNDCYFTTPTYSPINNDFLVNAINSHIITNWNTIVIGKTSASINKMINTLALFMPNEKLKISCYALEDYEMLSPYFCLQGFVTENPEDLNTMLDANFLFKKDSPTTIVDLSYKQIYRTPILNEFNTKKEAFILNKLQFLYNSLTLNDLNVVYPINNYLSWCSSISVSKKAFLITNMLKQMDILESDFGVKDSFVDLVQKDFYLMALNLIEYINNELINNSTSKKEKLTKISIKRVCKDLDIKSDEDLNILISYANYLKPGFSSNFLFQA